MSTRMFGRVSYNGEVLRCRRAHDAHKPSHSFGLLGQAAKHKCPSFEVYVFEQTHRIKKSQAWSCDTCSELRQNARVTAELKFASL